MITNTNTLNVPLSDITQLSVKKSKDWKPLGRLPIWLSKIDGSVPELLKVKRANRYLAYQERNIMRLTEKKEFEKVTIIWCLMLKNSTTYQLTLYNKVRRNWYWELTIGDAIRDFKICANKLRKFDVKLDLKRFYIPKKSGKMRPIGSPSIPSRLIAKSINDLIYLVKRGNMADFQHGYRMEKGTHTALLSVWKKIIKCKDPHVMEFDFKSFFNTIDLSWVYVSLIEYSNKLAFLVNKVVSEVEYTLQDGIKWKNLPNDESELHYKGWIHRENEYRPVHKEESIQQKSYKKVKGPTDKIKPVSSRPEVSNGLIIRRIATTRSLKRGQLLYRGYCMVRIFCQKGYNWYWKITRTGVPQGLAMSPLLATLAVEWLDPPKGLVMYADDGVVIRDDGDFSEFDIWIKKLRKLRIFVAPEKTGMVDNTFKFLGVEFNLQRRTAQYGDSKITWAGWDLSSPHLEVIMNVWFRQVAQLYGKKSEGWTWELKKNSSITQYKVNLNWVDWIKTIWKGIWLAKDYKGNRYFLGKGIYNISRSSTLCCGDMLSRLKDITMVKKRALNLSNKPGIKPDFIAKGKYLERNMGNFNGAAFYMELLMRKEEV
jgi:hypothetical protein